MWMLNWQEPVEKAMWRVICSVFGLDPLSEEAASLIRYAGRDDGTDVRPPRNTDVIYITVSQEQDVGSTSWISTRYESGRAHTMRTIPLLCLLTCYGPTSDLYADALWAGVWADTGPGSPRDILRINNLTPVPPLQRPVSVPEQEDGNWRKRSDVRVRLNLHMESDTGFQPIVAAPDVIIEH